MDARNSELFQLKLLRSQNWGGEGGGNRKTKGTQTNLKQMFFQFAMKGQSRYLSKHLTMGYLKEDKKKIISDLISPVPVPSCSLML